MTELARLLHGMTDGVRGPSAVSLAGIPGPAPVAAGRTSAGGPAARPSTLFDVASVTKIVTTLAIMRLRAEGALGLDARVRDLLPGFSGGAKDAVTVRMLLLHRAGLTEWWPLYADATDGPAVIGDPRAAIARAAALPLAYAPDSGRHYSDLGFQLLGAIVEAAHGSGLRDAVAALVTGPLGLRDTSYGPVPDAAATSDGDSWERRMIATGEPYPVPAEAPRGSRVHLLRGEVNDGNAHHAFGGAAGHAGIFSTAADVARLGAVMLGHHLGLAAGRRRGVRGGRPRPGAGPRLAAPRGRDGRRRLRGGPRPSGLHRHGGGGGPGPGRFMVTTDEPPPSHLDAGRHRGSPHGRRPPRPQQGAVMTAHPESVFTYGAPQLKFGPGASAEIGFDLAQFGARRVLVVTDPGVATTGAPERIAGQMRAYGVEAEVFDGVRVEPTDEAMRQAVEYARASGPWDAYVAVGGGSSIDTAKAVNLLTTNDGELEDYLNAPIGAGRAPSEPLRPLVAVPTTTGTGAESTTVCVMDVLSLRVKTGISHPRLRPALAVVDPDLTITQPAGVTASAGMDIVCHALESYTARPYTSYERKAAEDRVPYCGSNPVSDMWAERALGLIATSFRAAVHDGDNARARGDMALAATFAGLGFGNAGVHIPHANAYPIAGQVGDFHPDGYPRDEPMVPHGMSVALTAPEAFRFTFDAAPDRHVRAAGLLSPGAEGDPAGLLPSALLSLMRDVGLPNGIGGVGYGEGDVPDLVEGAMKQQRLLATSPKPVTEDDVAEIMHRSLSNW